MLRDAWLMAVKDVKVELNSRVVTAQILPFGGLVLILFGLAISPDLRVVGEAQRSVLEEVAPGLFWLAVLLSALMALSPSVRVGGQPTATSTRSAWPASTRPASSSAKRWRSPPSSWRSRWCSASARSWCSAPRIDNPAMLAATLLSSPRSGSRSPAPSTLRWPPGCGVGIPWSRCWSLPALAPVLLGATLALRDALFADPAIPGWSWTMLLAVFSLLYLGVGMLAFGPLLEEH